MRYANGQDAVGTCDRCGFVVPYPELKKEPVTGLRCCDECRDKKHPQLEPTRKDLGDPYPLRHPRPKQPSPPMNPADDLENFFPSTAGQKHTP